MAIVKECNRKGGKEREREKERKKEKRVLKKIPSLIFTGKRRPMKYTAASVRKEDNGRWPTECEVA